MPLRSWIATWLRDPPPAIHGAFPFVHVEDDGTARELDADEREYLREAFPPGDGGRPYVKWRYESRTPDGRLRGYLRRDRLPRHVRVRPASTW